MAEMTTNTDMGEAMDWDTAWATSSGGFTLLDPGVYPFEVAKIEKERFDGSARMAPCPQAKVTLKCQAGNREATVFDRLRLNTKTQWLIAQFFEGLGYERDPETGNVPIRWNEAEGKTGWVRVSVREYQSNGQTRQTNQVDEYVNPADFEACYKEYAAAFSAPQAVPAGTPSMANAWKM